MPPTSAAAAAPARRPLPVTSRRRASLRRARRPTARATALPLRARPMRPALRPAAAARPAPATRSRMAALRKWFLAGLLVIVPAAVTLAVLRWIIETLDQTLLILPEAWQPDR